MYSFLEKDGVITDPLTNKEIKKDEVFVLRQIDECVHYTSYDSLYKNFILNNSKLNPFDRTAIDNFHLIEKYGRDKKVIARIYYPLSEDNVDTVYLFDYFVKISAATNALCRELKTNNPIFLDRNNDDIISEYGDREIGDIAIDNLIYIEIADERKEGQNSIPPPSRSMPSMSNLFETIATVISNSTPTIPLAEQTPENATNMLENFITGMRANIRSQSFIDLMASVDPSIDEVINNILVIPSLSDGEDEEEDLDLD